MTTLEANLSLLKKSKDETETRKLCETILNCDNEGMKNRDQFPDTDPLFVFLPYFHVEILR